MLICEFAVEVLELYWVSGLIFSAANFLLSDGHQDKEDMPHLCTPGCAKL